MQVLVVDLRFFEALVLDVVDQQENAFFPSLCVVVYHFFPPGLQLLDLALQEASRLAQLVQVSADERVLGQVALAEQILDLFIGGVQRQVVIFWLALQGQRGETRTRRPRLLVEARLGSVALQHLVRRQEALRKLVDAAGFGADAECSFGSAHDGFYRELPRCFETDVGGV